MAPEGTDKRSSKGRRFCEADPRWAALAERMAETDVLWERAALTLADISHAEFWRKLQALERRRKRGSVTPAKKTAPGRRR